MGIIQALKDALAGRYQSQVVRVSVSALGGSIFYSDGSWRKMTDAEAAEYSRRMNAVNQTMGEMSDAMRDLLNPIGQPK